MTRTTPARTAGCPNEGRFVDNQDGTVTDTCTGLMWQQATAQERLAWREAIAYCARLHCAGHSDWRLPNVRELQSIVDYGRSVPSSDPIFGAESGWYWSSSTYVLYPSYAWSVNFSVGGVYSVNKDYDSFVRAVRGPTGKEDI